MDNWGGSRWTYQRKPRKFLGKSNQTTGDKIGRDSWTFTTGRHTSETRISKEERQKRERLKKLLFVIIGIPVLAACCFMFLQTRQSFVNYGKYQAEIEKINTTYLEENKNAYHLAIVYGKNALKNGDYEVAVQEFEFAFNIGEQTETFYNDLILACVLSCEKLKTNCKKVEKYDKLSLE